MFSEERSISRGREWKREVHFKQFLTFHNPKLLWSWRLKIKGVDRNKKKGLSWSEMGLKQTAGFIKFYGIRSDHMDNLNRLIWREFVVPLAQISLTLSCHFFLSFVDSDRVSRLHPVSPHSCCMYVRAGHPAFARPYVGVHRSTSLMSSSLLLQQCLTCLVRLIWIVFVMGDRWPYSWCLVGCCRQDLFNIARSILV